jgi:hypothetical protein
MPVLTPRLRRVGIAGVAALALAVGVPVGARADGDPAAGCPDGTVAQTFQHWLDPAWYVQAPDGGLEQGAAGWTLLGHATVADGNEPYHVGSADDTRSLALAPGASATTAPMCIGIEHPTIRFFARNTGAPHAQLKVSVVYRDAEGHRRLLTIGLVTGDTAWAPTPVLPVVVNLLALLGEQQAAFQFTPADDDGNWWIDDIYVDPYSKG